MTRPSTLLLRLDHAIEDIARKRRWWIGEVILFGLICAEVWIGIARTAALYPVGP